MKLKVGDKVDQEHLKCLLEANEFAIKKHREKGKALMKDNKRLRGELYEIFERV